MDIKSKFVIECIKPEYWDGPRYLRKIGSHDCHIEWTDDIYKAKTYETKQRAEKESLRMSNYVESCYKRGSHAHCYGWDAEKQIGLRMKSVEGTVKEIQITFI